MNKYELTEHLADRLIDPWTDCPEDYADAEPIDLEYAKTLLQDLINDDEDMDDPDYCVPKGTTPELLMEVYNCLIRARQHELHVKRFAEYLTENECVCEYDQYRNEYENANIPVYPVDWLFNMDSFDDFPFTMIDDTYPNALFLIELGQRSKHFNSTHEFCWYDKTLNELFSSDTPFADGIIEADKFAEYILSPEGHDCLDYFLGSILDDDEIHSIFGRDEQSVRTLYHI